VAITFDAKSIGAGGAGTPADFTHTPVGTPALVAVAITQDGADTDQITGATYGGVTMARAIFKASGGGSAVYVYDLLAAIPTGAQTVHVGVSTTNIKHVACATFTAAAAVTRDDANVVTGADAVGSANPSLAVTGTATGGQWIVALVNDLATAVTGRGAGQVALDEVDEGQWNMAWSYLPTVSGSQTPSYVIASDFWAMVAVPYYEAAGAAASADTPPLFHPLPFMR
jgi:hypothetical protein